MADLTKRLLRDLADGKRVLWLVSGGSNIPVSAQIMGNISPRLQQKLSIMLADERYGVPDHIDSNWDQLLRGGFRSRKAKLLPVLKAGLNFEQTVNRYEKLAKQAFSNSDSIVAQLGIGESGSIAGILPDSPATEETKSWVVGYQSTPFLRLTLSFMAFRHISAAYAFAFGSMKHLTLTSLRNRSLLLVEQPAQILKQLPEAYVYSDQFGAGV